MVQDIRNTRFQCVGAAGAFLFDFPSHEGDYADDGLYSGIVYQTAAIDAIDFKFSSGNIDAGIIKMFGVK